MSIKIISNYVSDNELRSAMVYKVLESGEIKVSVTNESGSTFSSLFDSIDLAEDYAEDWVMNT
jgi:hypothetical protein